MNIFHMDKTLPMCEMIAMQKTQGPLAKELQHARKVVVQKKKPAPLHKIFVMKSTKNQKQRKKRKKSK